MLKESVGLPSMCICMVGANRKWNRGRNVPIVAPLKNCLNYAYMPNLCIFIKCTPKANLREFMILALCQTSYSCSEKLQTYTTCFGP